MTTMTRRPMSRTSTAPTACLFLWAMPVDVGLERLVVRAADSVPPAARVAIVVPVDAGVAADVVPADHPVVAVAEIAKLHALE